MAKKKSTETTDTKTGKPEKAKPAKKPQQMKLPAEGMSRKAVAEIDKAAENYREKRDVRMEHTKLEKAAKSVLIDVAKKHLAEAAKNDPKGIATYVYESEDGEEFEVRYIAKSAENVKVKKVTDEDDGDGDDE